MPAIMYLTFQYNKELKKNLDNKKSKEFIQIINEDYANKLSSYNSPCSLDEAGHLYEKFISSALIIEGEVMIGPNDYEFNLQINVWLSWILFKFDRNISSPIFLCGKLSTCTRFPIYSI